MEWRHQNLLLLPVHLQELTFKQLEVGEKTIYSIYRTVSIRAIRLTRLSLVKLIKGAHYTSYYIKAHYYANFVEGGSTIQ